MGRKFIDISGQRFGKLLVNIDHKTKTKDGNLYWECVCDCGGICYVTSSDLKRGRENYCPNCVNEKSINSPIKSLYGSYKRGAINRNLCFELTMDEFKNLIFQNCNYCGIEPEQIFKKKDMKNSVIYNGIDRRDNDLGYTLDNSVTACKYCNLGKSIFKEADFIKWINRLKTHEF